MSGVQPRVSTAWIVADLATEARKLSEAQFLERHPDAWIVEMGTGVQVADDFDSLQTVVQPVQTTSGHDPTAGISRILQSSRAWPLEKRTDTESDRVSFGRARTNDVVLPDPGVSKLHGFWLRSGGAMQLVDIGSSNGTYVDGQRLAPQVPATPEDVSTLRIGAGLSVMFCCAASFWTLLRTVSFADGDLLSR